MTTSVVVTFAIAPLLSPRNIALVAVVVNAHGGAWLTRFESAHIRGVCVLGELIDTGRDPAQFVCLDNLGGMARQPLADRVSELERAGGPRARLMYVVKRASSPADAVRFVQAARMPKLRRAAEGQAPPYPTRGLVLVFTGNYDGESEWLIEESSFELVLEQPGRVSPEEVELLLEIDGRSGAAQLDMTQARAVRAAREGRNLFLTGKPGCGKTFVLQRIIEALKDDLGEEAVLVTAPTGVAALQCGGQTVHQCPGPYWPNPEEMLFVAEVMCKPRRHAKWKSLRVLIVDEISMLDAELLDWFDCSVREARDDLDNAFGGLQLVFCGDFAQLPPVKNSDQLRSMNHQRLAAAFARSDNVKPDGKPGWLPFGLAACSGKYAFESCCWREAALHVQLLKLQHRQSSSEHLLRSALDALRAGDCGHAQVQLLVQTTARTLAPLNGVEPTRLFCRRSEVDELNQSRLAALAGQARVFAAEDECQPLDVFQGTPTMFNKKRRQLENDCFFRACMAPRRLELRVGAQVVLLKRDLGTGVPADGAGDPSSSLVNGSRGIVESFSPAGLPVVAFANGRREEIGHVQFAKAVMLTGRCARRQLPLALAWALTVHKSQGLTLDRVCVDLEDEFERGQAYVAISRVQHIDGLQIEHFSGAVQCSYRVKCFYEAVERGDMQRFVDEEERWWHVIASGPSWRTRFRRRSVHFERWMQAYWPGAGNGGEDDDGDDDNDDDDGDDGDDNGGGGDGFILTRQQQAIARVLARRGASGDRQEGWRDRGNGGRSGGGGGRRCCALSSAEAGSSGTGLFPPAAPAAAALVAAAHAAAVPAAAAPAAARATPAAHATPAAAAPTADDDGAAPGSGEVNAAADGDAISFHAESDGDGSGSDDGAVRLPSPPARRMRLC
jgi:ATP-dependent DNA helicase PIF1